MKGEVRGKSGGGGSAKTSEKRECSQMCGAKYTPGHELYNMFAVYGMVLLCKMDE